MCSTCIFDVAYHKCVQISFIIMDHNNSTVFQYMYVYCTAIAFTGGGARVGAHSPSPQNK